MMKNNHDDLCVIGAVVCLGKSCGHCSNDDELRNHHYRLLGECRYYYLENNHGESGATDDDDDDSDDDDDDDNDDDMTVMMMMMRVVQILQQPLPDGITCTECLIVLQALSSYYHRQVI